MRYVAWLVVLGMLGSSALSAQQSEDASDAPSGKRASVPLPDKDGVYGVVDGIVPPVMTSPESPVFPSGISAELAHPVHCVLSAVIGVDGIASRVQVVQGCNDTFNKAAIDSVTRSKYQAGTLDGKPVPVLVHIRQEFQDPLFANAPRLALRYRESEGIDRSERKNYDTPPKPIHTVEAEFSEQARREGTEGIVIVSLTVDESGMPTNLHVTRFAGSGLDEQALKAVSQYRFQPATKDGKPVATTISVEVSFRLHVRPR